jgi:MoxR-like ATPase
VQDIGEPRIGTLPEAPAAGADGDARAALGRLRAEVGKVVVGQDAVVSGLVIALVCRGHVLLEGVPGVAKTLLVRTLARALSLSHKRIQFTPDLMPGDVTGSLVYDARSAEFEFREGPVFTNLLLADEINRTPPKTQSALLEAMEERQVTIDGVARTLPEPFTVAATQNPIEYEGTYSLPEAQLDRFLLKLTVPLPERTAELAMLSAHHRGFDPHDLAAAPSLALGASPRASAALLSAVKAWAWLAGRDFVTPDDVKALVRPVLRHRVRLRPEAELAGVTSDAVLDSVLASVPTPR